MVYSLCFTSGCWNDRRKVDTFEKEGEGEIYGKKGRQNLRPVCGRSGKVDALRRIRGKGVKIYEPEEDEEEPKVEVKVKEEVVEMDIDEDGTTDGEVKNINERHFNFLVQLANDEKDRLNQL